MRGSDVPSALEDLLDAALVTRTTGTNVEPRFGMLETVRGTRRSSSPARRGARRPDRHLDWFLAAIEGDGLYWQRKAAVARRRRARARQLPRRARPRDRDGDVQRELRLVNALRYFWRVRGYIVEGRRRLEAP